MRRNEALAILRAHEQELRAKGVVHLSLFGSVARDEAGPDSDVDLLAEYDESRGLSLFDLGSLYADFEDMLGCRIDLAEKRRLKERVAKRALPEAVSVF